MKNKIQQNQKPFVSIMKPVKCFKITVIIVQFTHIFLLVLSPALSIAPAFVVQDMKRHKIIPDLIDVPPPFGCQLHFGKMIVDFGNKLKPYQVAKEPDLTYWPTSKNKLYTLLMVDLDEPHPKSSNLKEYLHWLVVNIPEYTAKDGECIAPYLQPEPMDDQHRFAFLVFEQPRQHHAHFNVITDRAEANDSVRGNFSWQRFAKMGNFGKPHAVNFFRVEKSGPMDLIPKEEDLDDDDDGSWMPQAFAKVSPFVVREMKYFKIIPDLLKDTPPFPCQVNYWKEVEADFGNRLEPYQVATQPIETVWPVDKGKLYTLLMVDLDVPHPKNPVLREYLLWLVVNIPEDKFLNGECIAPYLPPDTPDDPHRIVFLVFEQQKPHHIDFHKITDTATANDNVRGKFSWRQFAKAWDLGNPYAINFLQIEMPSPTDRRRSMAQSDDDGGGGWLNF